MKRNFLAPVVSIELFFFQILALKYAKNGSRSTHKLDTKT